MNVVESVISNGVDRFVEVLSALGDNNVLLVNLGSFVHKERVGVDSQTEITVLERALKEKRINRVGKIVFKGVPIKYLISLRGDMSGYKHLYVRYTFAVEEVNFETVLITVSHRRIKVKVRATNIYAIEVSVRPLFETAMFAFNMNYRLAPFLKPTEFLIKEELYRKAMLAPNITREGTLLWKIRNQAQEFKQALLSVLQPKPEGVNYYR